MGGCQQNLSSITLQIGMMDKVFLATTALEEFWDKKASNGLFLGEWCKLFDRQTQNKHLNFKTLEYIWESENEIDKGIEYCEKIYQSILIKLIPTLNKYHNVDYDYKYWDILLRPWLLIYIQIIYDRYRHLKLALKRYNNIYTYTIKESEYQYINMPTTFFNNIINSDEYNLQIYSQIIKFLNINFTDINYKMKKYSTKIELKSTKKEKIFRAISRVLTKVFSNRSILIVSPYFKNNSLKKIITLLLKSRFLFVFDNLRYDINIDVEIDLRNRKNIFSSLKNSDEFENLILDTMIYNFPSIYLEGYKRFDKTIDNLPIYKSSSIYSANALHSNEIFKFYVAKNNKNLQFLYGQHGGNIGIDKIIIIEEIERNFADKYFTFGWNEKNTIVLPSLKYNIENRKKEGIIFIMTNFPRYFYRFTYQEDSSKIINYIKNSKQFLSTLKSINNLTVRMYMQDYGWSIKKRLLEINKNLKFDNHTNYYKQIINAKITIFDHMHTGYLETLSMNIPTIIIITKNIYYFRDNAKPYIQKLKDVNILFDDPIKASTFVDKIYNDIEKWWLSSEVQKVRKEFCYNYARTSENWADDWIEAFNKVINVNAKR